MFGRRFGSLVAAAAIALTTVACAETDPGITTAVKSKLAADDTVKSYRIDVDTKNRVVTLNGAVDTPRARERAVELAKATDGVTDVVDRLTVTPGVTPTTGVDDKVQGEAKEAARETDAKTDRAKDKADAKTDSAQKKAGDTADRAGDSIGNAALTSSIKTKFLADTAISGLSIDVDSNNGVVTLTGTVPSAAEKARALKVAKETEGVKRVVDRLKVGK
jgi:hyperosmotically inducible periplasmic protein